MNTASQLAVWIPRKRAGIKLPESLLRFNNYNNFKRGGQDIGVYEQKHSNMTFDINGESFLEDILRYKKMELYGMRSVQKTCLILQVHDG